MWAARAGGRKGLVSDSTDDGDAVSRARTRAEFDALYKLHFARVRDFIERRVHVDDLEDVLAEVFTVAWRRRLSVPSDAKIQAAWLYKVARFTLLNWQRQDRRKRDLWDRIANEAATASPVETTASRPELFENALVEAAFYSLSPADQEIVGLAAWEGCTSDELALILECSPGAARTRLSRARERLRVAMLRGSS